MNDFLGIRSKVDIAIDYLTKSGERISISKVCKIAEINRSNLYVTYPDLVEKILELRGGNSRGSKGKEFRPKQNLKIRPAGCDDVALLAHACLELRVALDEALQEIKTLKVELADALVDSQRCQLKRRLRKKP